MTKCDSLPGVARKRATLRDLVTSTGTPIGQVAERGGFTRASLHRWMAGTHSPHDFMLPRLAESLGVDIDTVRKAIEATRASRDS